MNKELSNRCASFLPPVLINSIITKFKNLQASRNTAVSEESPIIELISFKTEQNDFDKSFSGKFFSRVATCVHAIPQAEWICSI